MDHPKASAAFASIIRSKPSKLVARSPLAAISKSPVGAPAKRHDAAGRQHAADEAADAARPCHANRSACVHIQLSLLSALR